MKKNLKEYHIKHPIKSPKFELVDGGGDGDECRGRGEDGGSELLVPETTWTNLVILSKTFS